MSGVLIYLKWSVVSGLFGTWIDWAAEHLAGSIVISHLVIAVLAGLFKAIWESQKAQSWVSVAFLVFVMLTFGATWCLVPFPGLCQLRFSLSHFERKAWHTPQCPTDLIKFVIARITPQLIQIWDTRRMCVAACFCLVSRIRLYFGDPENNGRML